MMRVHFVNFRRKWRRAVHKDVFDLFLHTTHYGFLKIDVFDVVNNKTAYLEIDPATARELIEYIEDNII